MASPVIPRQPSRREPCRVVLVDERPVVRAALSMALPRSDFDVATRDHIPDDMPSDPSGSVVVLADGLTQENRERLPRLKSLGDVPVVLATSETREAAALLEAGLVDAVLGPEAGVEGFCRAIRRARAGDRFIVGLEHPSTGQVEPHVELTGREEQVLRLMASGSSNQAISTTLGISVNTVRNHVHTLLHKLGVGHRVAAVRRATDLGLLGRSAS